MPTPHLAISLLGLFQLSCNGVDISRQIKYRKGIYLLACLAVSSGRWIAREQLADLLWPDLRTEAALTNLRQVLSNLAKVINDAAGAPVIQGKRDSIIFMPHPQVKLDIALLFNEWNIDDVSAAFKGWLTKELEPQLHHLNQDFLARAELGPNTELRHWLELTRRQLRERWHSLLSRLCREQEQAGRIASAVLVANQLWEQDALNEHAAATLIQLLLACGDIKRADFVLNSLDQQLLSAFGTRASSSTRALLSRPSEAVSQSVASVPRSLQSVPEIRWLTIMYVEFEPQAKDAGIQDVTTWALMASMLSQAEEHIRRWGGSCLATLGQGFHAVFGLQSEPEQAVLRSIYAAQDILHMDQARSYLRIGLCAGHVECRADEQHFPGPLPRRAQQLCWHGQAGQLQVDQMIVDRSAGQIAFDTVPDGPLNTYALAAVLQVPEALQACALVGRAEEVAALMQHWQLARAGQPQWLILKGDAGIGKTRLASELSQMLDLPGHTVLRMYCTLEYQHQSLAPVRRALAELFGISANSAVGQGMQKIAACLRSYLPGVDIDPALLHTLMSLFDSSLVTTEADNKNLLFNAISWLLDAFCRNQPCLIVIDDMHWSDFATRELLARYAGNFDSQRLLLLVTTRPESVLEYAGAAPATIELSPLPVGNAVKMVAMCDVYHQLSEEQYVSIANDCGGIPLFIERLTRSLLDDASHHLVPVKELLQRELDRLGPFKNIIQVAAVIGMHFRLPMLQILLPGQEVQATLQLAVAYRLIQSGKHDGYYHFSHALISDAAYQSLPPEQRRSTHQRVAEYLVSDGSAVPTEIAHHFDQAAIWPQALQWWSHSGELALRNEFAMDALHHFQRALDIALDIAPTSSHPMHEHVIALRLSVGSAALLCQGYGSELGHRQFLAVCDALNQQTSLNEAQNEALFQALSGLYMGGSSQGKNDGLMIARRLEERADTPAKRLMACFALGNSLFWRGCFVDALHYQQEGVQIAGRLSADERQRYWREDMEVLIRAFLSWNNWFLGDTATQTLMQESIAIARDRKKSHALCFMLTFAAGVCWTDERSDDSALLAAEGVQLGTQFGFPLWQSMNSLFYLSAQARKQQLTDPRPALDAAESLRDAYRAGTTTARWVLSDTLVHLGCWEQAQALLEQSIRDIDVYEDYYCHADLLRLYSMCLVQQGQVSEALQALRQGLEIAEHQGALGVIRKITLAIQRLSV
ncbi:AAA family ATPase [Undibacterium sp. SXout7W]|uniref:AAA family ATPase n=1 Tax=Undibacterium sp. SXout7W TaxID=3413049 RepID=UPI003BF0D170